MSLAKLRVQVGRIGRQIDAGRVRIALRCGGSATLLRWEPAVGCLADYRGDRDLAPSADGVDLSVLLVAEQDLAAVRQYKPTLLFSVGGFDSAEGGRGGMLVFMTGVGRGLHVVDLGLPSALTELRDDRLADRGVRVMLKRDDLIHPEFPGNKWRKLKYNLAAAKDGGHETLLTFGGAYSNHIRATAAAGYYGGFRTIGVIRGEEHLPLNPSLAYASSRGMELTYLDRTSYRAQQSAEVVDPLRRKFGDFYLLPEGGSNAESVRGCSELPGEIGEPFDVIFCPVGTGGTLAGIAGALEGGQRAVGVAVLKGGEFLNAEVERLQRLTFGMPSGNWSIECGFHFGGYAKRTPALDTLVDDFQVRHGMRLDWVYVAKMMSGLFAMVKRGEFAVGTRIVAVVTGTDLPPLS